MAYPRNAATPPRIAIGAVIQISDGAVQSSGVSVVVRPEGGSETAGGGTISYGATTSVVYYEPTQAETDYTAFVVVAYKTGCIPVEKTVVTVANATAGVGVVPDTQKLDLNTIKGQAITCSAGVIVSPFVGSTGAAVNGTNANTLSSHDPGATLGTSTLAAGAQMDLVNAPNATALAAIGAKVEAMVFDEGDATALLAAIAAKVEEFLINEGDATATIAAIATACNTAIVAGTVGSNVTDIKAKTDNLPASPAAVGDAMTLTAAYDAAKIAASQADITGGAYALNTDALGSVRIVDGTGVGELDTLSGTVLLRSATQASIDAIEADTNELQTNQGNWLTATGFSTHTPADVRTELATELARIDVATSTRQATVPNLANVVTMAAQFSTMIIVDGVVYDFTAAALAAGPSSSGLTAQETRDAMKLAPTAGDPAAGSIDKHLDDLDTAVDLLAGAAGPGGIAWEVTVNDSEGDPIGDVGCWVSTDAAGSNVIAGTLYTTEFGIVTFMLNAGTYYLWRNSTSHDFTNPQIMVVS